MNPEVVKYDNKLKELKKYLPFLDDMEARYKKAEGHQTQLLKIQGLKNLIKSDKRIKIDNLLKCEQILEKLLKKTAEKKPPFHIKTLRSAISCSTSSRSCSSRFDPFLIATAAAESSIQIKKANEGTECAPVSEINIKTKKSSVPETGNKVIQDGSSSKVEKIVKPKLNFYKEHSEVESLPIETHQPSRRNDLKVVPNDKLESTSSIEISNSSSCVRKCSVSKSPIEGVTIPLCNRPDKKEIRAQMNDSKPSAVKNSSQSGNKIRTVLNRQIVKEGQTINSPVLQSDVDMRNYFSDVDMRFSNVFTGSSPNMNTTLKEASASVSKIPVISNRQNFSEPPVNVLPPGDSDLRVISPNAAIDVQNLSEFNIPSLADVRKDKMLNQPYNNDASIVSAESGFGQSNTPGIKMSSAVVIPKKYTRVLISPVKTIDSRDRRNDSGRYHRRSPSPRKRRSRSRDRATKNYRSDYHSSNRSPCKYSPPRDRDRNESSRNKNKLSLIKRPFKSSRRSRSKEKSSHKISHEQSIEIKLLHKKIEEIIELNELKRKREKIVQELQVESFLDPENLTERQKGEREDGEICESDEDEEVDMLYSDIGEGANSKDEENNVKKSTQSNSQIATCLKKLNMIMKDKSFSGTDIISTTKSTNKSNMEPESVEACQREAFPHDSLVDKMVHIITSEIFPADSNNLETDKITNNEHVSKVIVPKTSGAEVKVCEVKSKRNAAADFFTPTEEFNKSELGKPNKPELEVDLEKPNENEDEGNDSNNLEDDILKALINETGANIIPTAVSDKKGYAKEISSKFADDISSSIKARRISLETYKEKHNSASLKSEKRPQDYQNVMKNVFSQKELAKFEPILKHSFEFTTASLQSSARNVSNAFPSTPMSPDSVSSNSSVSNVSTNNIPTAPLNNHHESPALPPWVTPVNRDFDYRLKKHVYSGIVGLAGNRIASPEPSDKRLDPAFQIKPVDFQGADKINRPSFTVPLMALNFNKPTSSLRLNINSGNLPNRDVNFFSPQSGSETPERQPNSSGNVVANNFQQNFGAESYMSPRDTNVTRTPRPETNLGYYGKGNDLFEYRGRWNESLEFPNSTPSYSGGTSPSNESINSGDFPNKYTLPKNNPDFSRRNNYKPLNDSSFQQSRSNYPTPNSMRNMTGNRTPLSESRIQSNSWMDSSDRFVNDDEQNYENERFNRMCNQSNEFNNKSYWAGHESYIVHDSDIRPNFDRGRSVGRTIRGSNFDSQNAWGDNRRMSVSRDAIDVQSSDSVQRFERSRSIGRNTPGRDYESRNAWMSSDDQSDMRQRFDRCRSIGRNVPASDYDSQNAWMGEVRVSVSRNRDFRQDSDINRDYETHIGTPRRDCGSDNSWANDYRMSSADDSAYDQNLRNFNRDYEFQKNRNHLNVERDQHHEFGDNFPERLCQNDRYQRGRSIGKLNLQTPRVSNVEFDPKKKFSRARSVGRFEYETNADRDDDFGRGPFYSDRIERGRDSSRSQLRISNSIENLSKFPPYRGNSTQKLEENVDSPSNTKSKSCEFKRSRSLAKDFTIENISDGSSNLKNESLTKPMQKAIELIEKSRKNTGSRDPRLNKYANRTGSNSTPYKSGKRDDPRLKKSDSVKEKIEQKDGAKVERDPRKRGYSGKTDDKYKSSSNSRDSSGKNSRIKDNDRHVSSFDGKSSNNKTDHDKKDLEESLTKSVVGNEHYNQRERISHFKIPKIKRTESTDHSDSSTEKNTDQTKSDCDETVVRNTNLQMESEKEIASETVTHSKDPSLISNKDKLRRSHSVNKKGSRKKKKHSKEEVPNPLSLEITDSSKTPEPNDDKDTDLEIIRSAALKSSALTRIMNDQSDDDFEDNFVCGSPISASDYNKMNDIIFDKLVKQNLSKIEKSENNVGGELFPEESIKNGPNDTQDVNDIISKSAIERDDINTIIESDKNMEIIRLSDECDKSVDELDTSSKSKKTATDGDSTEVDSPLKSRLRRSVRLNNIPAEIPKVKKVRKPYTFRKSIMNKKESDSSQENSEETVDSSQPMDASIDNNLGADSFAILDKSVLSDEHCQSNAIDSSNSTESTKEYPSGSAKTAEISNLVEILKNKSKMLEILALLKDTGEEISGKVKKRLEKLAEIESDEEEDDSSKRNINVIKGDSNEAKNEQTNKSNLVSDMSTEESINTDTNVLKPNVDVSNKTIESEKAIQTKSNNDEIINNTESRTSTDGTDLREIPPGIGSIKKSIESIENQTSSVIGKEIKIVDTDSQIKVVENEAQIIAFDESKTTNDNENKVPGVDENNSVTDNEAKINAVDEFETTNDNAEKPADKDAQSLTSEDKGVPNNEVVQSIPSEEAEKNVSKKGFKKKKTGLRELQMLHEYNFDMFISADVLRATGVRSCTIAHLESASSSGSIGSLKIDEIKSKENKAVRSNEVKNTLSKTKSNLSISAKSKVKKAKAATSKMKNNADQLKSNDLFFPRIVIEKASVDNSMNDVYDYADDNGVVEDYQMIKQKPCPKSKKIILSSDDPPVTGGAKGSQTTEGKKSKMKNKMKKKRNSWKSGFITKKKKKGSSKIRKDINYCDKNYNFNELTKEYKCKICYYAGSDIVKHYKTRHPHSEVIISRLNYEQAQLACVEDISDLKNKPHKLKMYRCRFCMKLFRVKNLRILFDHIVYNHTGEYKKECTECSTKEAKKCVSVCNKSSTLPPADDFINTITGYMCSLCNYTQLSHENLKTHIWLRHFNEECELKEISLTIHNARRRMLKSGLEVAKMEGVKLRNKNKPRVGTAVILSTRLRNDSSLKKQSNEKLSPKRKDNTNTAKKILDSVDNEKDSVTKMTAVSNVDEPAKDKATIPEADHGIIVNTVEVVMNSEESNVNSASVDSVFHVTSELTNIKQEIHEEQLLDDLPDLNIKTEPMPCPIGDSSKELKTDVKVSLIDVQYIGNKTIYSCHINSCNFVTNYLLIFKSHIDGHNSKWNGHCDTCNKIVNTSFNYGVLKYDKALEHLLSNHSNSSAAKTPSMPIAIKEEYLKDENSKDDEQMDVLDDFFRNTQEINESIDNINSSEINQDISPASSQSLPKINVRSLKDLMEKGSENELAAEDNPAFCQLRIESVVSLNPNVTSSSNLTETNQNENSSGRDEGAKSETVNEKNLQKNITARAKPAARPNSTSLFKCAQCGYSSKTDLDFTAHINTHRDLEVYDCVYCKFSSSSCCGLIYHIIDQHGASRYKCTLCDYRGAVPLLVATHALAIHQLKLNNVIGVMPHESTMPVSMIKGLLPKHTCVSPYICKHSLPRGTCDKQFYSVDAFEKHVKTHGPVKLLCQLCPSSLPFPINLLLVHMKIRHKFAAMVCAFCRTGFTTSKEALGHFVLSHSGRRPLLYLRLNKFQGNNLSVDKLVLMNLDKGDLYNSTVLLSEDDQTSFTHISKKPAQLTESELRMILKLESQNDNVSPHKEIPSLIPINNSVLTEIVGGAPPAGDSPNKCVTTILEKNGVDKTEEKTPSEVILNDGNDDVVILDSDSESIPADSMQKVSRMSIDSVQSTSRESTDDVITSDIQTDNDASKKLTVEKSLHKVSTMLNVPFNSLSDDALRNRIKTTGISHDQLFKCGNTPCIYSSKSSNCFKDHLQICAHAREFSWHTCYHCKKSVKTTAKLMDHIKSHGTHRYQCNVCYYCSYGDHTVTQHMRKSHKMKNILKIPLRPFQCNEDYDFFVFKSVLNKGNVTQKSTVLGQKSSNQPTPPSPQMASLVIALNNAKKNIFGPDEINQLPVNPILSEEIYCKVCNFGTKVRSNLLRHLQMHANEVEVPSVAPINPVPHLESNEKHFDKMTNLALSSNINKPEKITKKEITPPSKETDKYPKYVPEKERFVCGSVGCKYISINELMLRLHWETLHSEESTFHCTHCKEDIKEANHYFSTGKIAAHLRLHEEMLYGCEKCSFLHPISRQMNKHCVDTHGKDYTVCLRKTSAPLSKATPTESDMDSWQCQLCPIKKRSEEAMALHCKNVHKLLQYKCSMCNISRSTKMFSDHFNKKHPQGNPEILTLYTKIDGDVEPIVDNSPLWWKQRKRASIFSEEGSSASTSDNSKPSPIKIARMQNTNDASKCNFDLTKGTLPSYQSVKTVEDKFSCPFCEKYTTIMKDEMKIHLFEELNYRNWACITCGYKSFSSDQILEHSKLNHGNSQTKLLKGKVGVERWVTGFLDYQAKEIEAYLSNPVPMQSEKSTIKPSAKPLAVDEMEKGLKKCPHCDWTARDISLHVKRHWKMKPLSCGHCNGGFVSASELRKHSTLSHPNQPFNILTNVLPDDPEIVPVISFKRKSAPGNIVCKISNKDHFCLACEQSLTEDEITVHKKTCFRSDMYPILKKNMTALKCSICTQLTPDNDKLQEHFKEEHPGMEINYVLHTIGKPKTKRLRAKTSDAPIMLSGTIESYKYLCSYCGGKLNSYSKFLTHHGLEHEGQLIRFNPLTLQSLEESEEMSVNMNLNGLYCCILGCSHKALNTISLLSHIRSHYITYKCHHCISVFSLYKFYIDHSRTHSSMECKNREEFTGNTIVQDRLVKIFNLFKNKNFIMSDSDEQLYIFNDEQMFLPPCVSTKPKQVARKSTTHLGNFNVKPVEGYSYHGKSPDPVDLKAITIKVALFGTQKRITLEQLKAIENLFPKVQLTDLSKTHPHLFT